MSSFTRQFIDKEMAGDDALPILFRLKLSVILAKYLHETKLWWIDSFPSRLGRYIVSVKMIWNYFIRTAKPYKLYCIHSSAPFESCQSIFNGQTEKEKLFWLNITELSITIPDVAFCHWFWKQKINMYSPALRMNSLNTTWISRSNSIQRLGRWKNPAGWILFVCIP